MRNHTILIAFIFYLFLNTGFLNAQFFEEYSTNSRDTIKVEQKIGLRFSGNAFFKNNEYFHPLVEGYTLPGFLFQPRLFYQIGDKFTLEAGVHMSQFSGKEGFYKVAPLFRAVYAPDQQFSIILGWLNGTTSHKLIEPLFQWERMYTHPLENGVQFLVNHPLFKLDTWIDWEKYIELNDPYQEELTFGTHAEITLLKKEPLEFSIPIQTTIKHQGGQITSLDEPLKTIANLASGIKVNYDAAGEIVRKLFFELYYVGYADLSPQKLQAYSHGFGIYPVFSANISWFRASLGYWAARHFIASKGEPLLMSVSSTNTGVLCPERSVVTGKLSFDKRIFKNVSFGAYAETYYDTRLSNLDYDYGISMMVSGEIFFKK